MEESDHPARIRQGPRYWLWPAIIVLLLGVHVSIWLGFTAVAVRDPSFAVEPDHYRKSLEWDATAAQRRSSEAVGWRVEIETSPETTITGDRRLVCRLTDSAGNAIAGAAVELVIFHHARGRERLDLILAEEQDGVYVATPRMRKTGIWECRLKARRGDTTFTSVVYHLVRKADGGAP